MMRDSFDCVASRCAYYSHAHCLNADCERVLYARGEGPVYSGDPDVIDGYEGAVVCKGCGDSAFMLCTECAEQNPLCPPCREELAGGCSKDCEECRVGAVA